MRHILRTFEQSHKSGPHPDDLCDILESGQSVSHFLFIKNKTIIIMSVQTKKKRGGEGRGRVSVKSEGQRVSRVLRRDGGDYGKSGVAKVKGR